MRVKTRAVVAILASLWCTITGAVQAADFPPPQSGNWTAKDFKFHTGAIMAELKVHYVTVGAPTGEPVLLLHGTTGSGAGLLTPAFAGGLFGAGQPLDASKYFVIMPDAIGHGQSAKPSDGLRMTFPRYDYTDMVDAQYRLLTEGLGIKHLRAVIGNSMGGMETWVWGERYPAFMDALVPMASQPTAMASRNWMMRRLIIDSIKADPDWNGGNYTVQPKAARFASVFYGVATSGGTLFYQNAASTHAAADKMLDERLSAPFTADANDTLYQWDASYDYDAAPDLEKIEAAVLAINAADDERNPPETGIMTKSLARIKNARLLLIPASGDTRGHSTTGFARFWGSEVASFLATVPRRGG